MVENIGIKLHFVNRFYSLGVEVVLQEMVVGCGGLLYCEELVSNLRK